MGHFEFCRTELTKIRLGLQIRQRPVETGRRAYKKLLIGQRLALLWQDL